MMEVEEEGAQSCPQRPGNVGLWDRLTAGADEIIMCPARADGICT